MCAGPEEIVRQCRCHHEGREDRPEEREGDRERHGREHLSLDALEREDGQEHEHDDRDREHER